MLRQQIILNNYIYIAEHYDANIDLLDNMYYQEYVMLRNYEIINNVVVDKDIYFIEKDVYFDICKNMNENNTKYTDIITFPIPNSKISGYSNFYENFNSLYNNNSFYNKNKSIGSDIYELYDSKGKSIEILCDLIKLYHPISNPSLNAVVHVYNIINGITFHYICKNYNKFKSKTNNEIIIDNEQYSEYIEIHIPNLHFLFNEDNVYFNDDLNLSVSEKNTDFLNRKSTNSFNLTGSFALMGYDFNEIKDELEDNNIIIGINKSSIVFKDIKNNILLDGIIDGYDNISKYPIIKLNNNDILLNNLDKILSNTKYLEISGYPIEVNDKLSYKISFVLYALNILIQPFRIVEEEVMNNEIISVKQYLKLRKSIENNYLNYPINLVLYPYSYLEENTNLYIIDDVLNASEITMFKKYDFQLSSKLGFDNGKLSLLNTFLYPNMNIIKNVKDAYKYFYNVTENEYINYKNVIEEQIKNYIEEHYNIKINSDLENYYNNYKEEIEEELQTSLDFIGFRFAIASDIYFKNIILEKNIYIDFNNLNNYNIHINDIFKNWNEMPEQLVCSVQFIDRYLGILLKSNSVVITKEWFKYIINEEGIFNIFSLNNKNKNMKEIELNNTNINFINNITCVVNKSTEKQDIINKNTNLKVLYKPYFFRTQELQNIKLRNSYIQNIGINLSEYMTKVETFKIVIDNNEYIEKGRNDIYVIFNINAKELSNTYGKYDILTQDDEYISTGNYTIY